MCVCLPYLHYKYNCSHFMEFSNYFATLKTFFRTIGHPPPPPSPRHHNTISRFTGREEGRQTVGESVAKKETSGEGTGGGGMVFQTSTSGLHF